MPDVREPTPSARDARAHQITRVSRAFTNARTLDEILRLAVEQAAELLHTDRAVLMLTDDAGLLRVRSAYGIGDAALERFANPLTESLVSRLLGMLGAESASGFAGVPVVSQGRVVGLLAAVRRDGERVGEEDEWLLSALADQVAAPLENARLATQLERSALLAENVRLFEAERAARIAAEAAQRAAEIARDRAVQADTSKSLFLAAMSHELRTPLNAIGGYVELLEMGLRGPITAEQLSDLLRIKASQTHLLRLINDVLEYARVGTDQTQPELRDVDLDQVLRETEAMIVPQIQRKGLHYSYSALSGALTIYSDPHPVKQIVLNLLTNAIKFTEAGGTIQLRSCIEADAAHRGRHVARVEVEDTGRGIPDEYIDAIWKPFVQIGRSLNQPGEGVGLGLTISRDLARRLGGELAVTSTVGKGSTFSLTLPLID